MATANEIAAGKHVEIAGFVQSRKGLKESAQFLMRQGAGFMTLLSAERTGLSNWQNPNRSAGEHFATVSVANGKCVDHHDRRILENIKR